MSEPLHHHPCIIVATNTQGVIAVDGQVPWKKPEDLKRFKRITMGSVLIMGRKTWDSIGRKPLSGRRTVVLSRTPQSDVLTASSLEEGLSWTIPLFPNYTQIHVPRATSAWIVGGAEVYEQAIPFVEEIDLTLVTDFIVDLERPNITKFPAFVHGMPGFEIVETSINPIDPSLTHYRYRRVAREN